MDILKIIFGVSSLFLAWVILFRTNLIIRINTWFRDFVFNDQFILFSKKRMAILMLVLGFVALFSGMDGLVKDQKISPQISEKMLENARESFEKRQYKRAVKICLSLVKSNPDNLDAWALLASAWWTLGEKREAVVAAKRIIQIAPEKAKMQYPVLKVILDKGAGTKK